MSMKAALRPTVPPLPRSGSCPPWCDAAHSDPNEPHTRSVYWGAFPALAGVRDDAETAVMVVAGQRGGRFVSVMVDDAGRDYPGHMVSLSADEALILGQALIEAHRITVGGAA